MKKQAWIILACFFVATLAYAGDTLTNLTELTDPDDADLMYIVDVSQPTGGTLRSKKATIANLKIEFAGSDWTDPVNASIVPDTDDTYDLGTGAAQFKDGYFDGTLEADVLTEGGVAVLNATETAAAYEAIDATITRADEAETLSANWVNTAYPWADNEVADTITASKYVPLAGGTLSGELVVDNLGLEFTAGDDHLDCSAFSATGGGIFFDDSEGVFKKCQDDVLTTLDTGGGGGGYTNLTEFIGQNNWQVFYSNGSGDVTELTVGAANTYLSGNGVTSAPTWKLLQLVTPGADADSSEVDTPSGLELIDGALTLLRGCADNQALIWDETGDDWNCEDIVAGTTVAWSNLTAPTVDDSIAFGNTEQTITSTIDIAQHSMLTLSHEDNDVSAENVTILSLEAYESGEADNYFIRAWNDTDGTPDVQFYVANTGYIYSDNQINVDFVEVTNASGSSAIRLYESPGNGAQSVELIAPAAITTSWDLILPDNDGQANQVLATPSGDGVTDWKTVYYPAGTDVAVTDGGTGRSTGTTAYSLIATGTTATGAQQTLANGLTTQILVGGGASALPAWGTDLPTAVTIGSGYIYRVGGTPVADGDVTDALTISGGTVNNSVIGGVTPAAGAFTTLSATGIVTFPIAADPTTDADGEMSFDTDGWAAGYDALEIWNGTASAYVVATTATDVPTNGQVPTFNTVGTITWEDQGALVTPSEITVMDTTDTSTIYVALFESATGDLGPKTDLGITYNAGTGILTATGLAGPLNGTVGAGTPAAGTFTTLTATSISATASATPKFTFNDSDAANGEATIFAQANGAFDTIMYLAVDVAGTETDYVELDGVTETIDLLKPVVITGNVGATTYGSDGSVTNAELLYINTLTSNAQTQITTNAALVDTDDEIIAIINASPSTYIDVAAGGTGVGTLADGGIVCGNAAGDVEVVAAVAAGQPLLSGGANTSPAYAGYTFTGTAAQTYTFPTTTASLARTDSAQTFTGAQTFSSTIVGSVNGNAATATLASTVTITDNESTAENNPLVFVENGDLDGGNLGLESDGTCYYTPSTGVVTATGFAGTLTGNVTGDCSGTAATVTGAAQANITSVGTLTGLAMSGAITGTTAITMGSATVDTGVFTMIKGAQASDPQATLTMSADGVGALTLATANGSNGDITITPSGGDTILTTDLTVSGGDITLGTSSIFSGGDTASLNNVDAIDATTETTIEAALDTLANVTSVGTLTGLTMAGIIADNDDMVFECDADSNGTNSFSFTDGDSTEIANLSEAGALQIDGDLTVSGNDVILGTAAAGVTLTGDGDGQLTIAGFGDGSDENLTINLDDTANTATIGTGTGVLDINIGTLNMVATGQISGRIPVVADADGKTLSGTDLYGSFQVATGDGTWLIPDVAAAAGTGQAFCLMATTAQNIIIDFEAPATDKIRFNGALQAAGIGITNASGEAIGDFVCLALLDFATDVAHWTVLGYKGTWVSQ